MVQPPLNHEKEGKGIAYSSPCLLWVLSFIVSYSGGEREASQLDIFMNIKAVDHNFIRSS